ncbi:hypothetical protein D9V41_03025 [Aeromicrobium phragmitis]|uniref:Uncharacterized protein n=1 Tax=Aeromicrobium phragmitis TaxID=2478914 RepID=A0A3L8PQN0_9ACTN|nr:hypothetical protein [Aeromicrobium phragmitis]RLV56768.1 hypothetical protein D9V41_03025 [Aeromicrobium phragmitis]
MEALNRPVHDLADLTAMWQAIAHPFGFSEPSLFVVMMDADGVLLPSVLDVKENPPRPDPALLADLAWSIERVIEGVAPGGSAAAMWGRPGRPPSRPDDDAWCRSAHEAFSAAAFVAWPVFFATDETVGIVPPDVLVG